MKIVKAPLGWVFDASTYISLEQARALKAAGVQVVMRYIRRDKCVHDEPSAAQRRGHEWPVSLSRQELVENLLAADLMVGLFQFGRFHGQNYLSAAEGKKNGEAAAWNVDQLGIPKGLTTFTDAEWTDAPSGRLKLWAFNRRALAYLKTWSISYHAGGHRPGVYEAYDGMNGRQWYSIPKVQAYYASAMKSVQMACVPEPRGFCAYQGWQHGGKDHRGRPNADKGRPAPHGVVLDTGFSTYDRKGARFYVVAP